MGKYRTHCFVNGGDDDPIVAIEKMNIQVKKQLKKNHTIDNCIIENTYGKGRYKFTFEIYAYYGGEPSEE